MINKLAMATFISNIIYSPFLVRAGGLEPPRLKRQRILSPVCLPIPPRSHDTIIADRGDSVKREVSRPHFPESRLYSLILTF